MLLSGEPGIGKSRLTAALLERIATEPNTRLRYFCSPQHTDSALYPIISQMERAAGFTHEDAPQTKLDKLTLYLRRPLRNAKTLRFSQDYCRYRMMDVMQHSNFRRSKGGRKRLPH